MTKRKSRKGKPSQAVLKQRASRKHQTLIGRLKRFWIRLRRTLLWSAAGVAAVVLGVWVVILIQSHSKSGSMGVHLESARKDFLLGDIDQAVLEYHQAQNVAPDDKVLHREATMVKQRAGVAGNASVQNAIAASLPVLQDDPDNVVANSNLARLYDDISDLPKVYFHAQRLFYTDEKEYECEAKLAAAVALESYFRQKDMFDSAFSYGSIAIEKAKDCGDQQNVSLAEAIAGFAALGLGELNAAHRLLHSATKGAGEEYTDLRELAYAGLADYFCQTADYDSCAWFAADVVAYYRDNPLHPTNAHAHNVLGRMYLVQELPEKAESNLLESLQMWRDLYAFASYIDNLNDLGDLYFASEDDFRARRYYLAASKLAERMDFPRKVKYDIDLNRIFLQRLPSDRFLLSGNEADSIANVVWPETSEQ